MYRHKLASISALIALSVAAHAGPSILVFSDDPHGGTDVTSALHDLNLSYTLTTTVTAFDNDLDLFGNKTWNLVIFSDTDLTQDPSDLDTFVSIGGKAIYDDWTQNQLAAEYFGAQFTGVNNWNSALTTGGGPLSGIGPVFNTPDPNGDWRTYTTGLAALPTFDDATGYGETPNGDYAVVEGNFGKTYINGFLDNVGGSQGVDVLQNEIWDEVGFRRIESPFAPGPSAIAPFAVGLIGMRRRKRARLSV